MTVLTWEAGRTLMRAHPHLFGSGAFDDRTATSNRFSPLRTPEGHVWPVIYAGSTDTTAAAETIFHSLPGSGRPRNVPLDRYRSWQWSPIVARRPLTMLAVDARHPQADVLIDCDALGCPEARTAIMPILSSHPDIDGLVWPFAQLHDQPSSVVIGQDTEVAVLLLHAAPRRQGGLTSDDLEAVDPGVPFALPAGTDRLDEVALALGVTVVRS